MKCRNHDANVKKNPTYNEQIFELSEPKHENKDHGGTIFLTLLRLHNVQKQRSCFCRCDNYYLLLLTYHDS